MYAYFNLYRNTGESRWRIAAHTLLAQAIRASEYEQNLPFSLYKGTLGVALLAAQAEDLDSARMPFFEEE